MPKVSRLSIPLKGYIFSRALRRYLCTRPDQSNLGAKSLDARFLAVGPAFPFLIGPMLTLPSGLSPKNSVRPRIQSRYSGLFLPAACIFFFLAGHAFLPHLGIEDDEALFVDAIFHPRAELYSLRLGHSHVPIMLMTYLGALKSLLYGPILRLFGTGIRVLREPMLLAGVASLYLFYCLLRKVAGVRAAYIGCGLLAVDSMYLLTICFDWGPVALQHLLLIGGVLLVAGFFQDGSGRKLAAGGFLVGLALWDKALAVWVLSGLGIGGILTFPRQIFAACTRRNLAVAAGGLLLGALPLLIYNAGHHWITFSGNFRRDTAPGAITGKFSMLVDTGHGDGLFGWMTDEDWQTPAPHAPEGRWRRPLPGFRQLPDTRGVICWFTLLCWHCCWRRWRAARPCGPSCSP